MWRTKKAPGLATQGSFRCFVWLDGADAASARALGARLDLEGHLLATAEAVDVTFGATPVEEEFLTVFGCDKAKATVRDQLLDGACGHFHLLSLELKANSTRRACSRNGACGERRYCTGYLEYTPSRYRLIPGVSARRRARDWSRLNFLAGVSRTEMSEVDDRMLDCFFSRQTLTRMSPGRFWMPTIIPSYTASPASMKVVPRSWAPASPNARVVPADDAVRAPLRCSRKSPAQGR